jgi:hypothetical protein
VIYTGGITPSNWRPLTSYGAYDQPTYWVDISPFIPILLDTKTHHSVTLHVVGQGVTAPSFNSDWFVSGSIHVRTGTSKTTGKMTSYSAPAVKISTTGGSSPGNTTVWTKVVAHRELKIESELLTSEGKKIVSFSQSLDFTNTAQYADEGWIQVSEGFERVSEALENMYTSGDSRAPSERRLRTIKGSKSFGMHSVIPLASSPITPSTRRNSVRSDRDPQHRSKS